MDTPCIKKCCALCETVITPSNDSREHIVPNSMGGRRKVRMFLCVDCNSRTGDSWDAELWRQFEHLAMMHGVRRDRGEPQPIQIRTIDGGQYRLLADGSMTIDRPIFDAASNESSVTINITARDTAQARMLAKQAAKKYPKLDVQEMLASATERATPLESPVTFTGSFGGDLAGRSMVKSALALAASVGVGAEVCDIALAYLRDCAVTPAYAMFYVRDLVANRPETHAINCVSIYGDPARRTLLGYVEYLSMSRVVVLLSESYMGEPITETYAFNPATGREIDLGVNLGLSEAEIEMVRSGCAATDETYHAAFGAGFDVIYKQSQQRLFDRSLREAVEYACEVLDLTPDGFLPPDKMRDFVTVVMERLGPTVARMDRRS
ncbi:HNH endonuclease [Burkholderia stagnalis]|uniref:HNH endonuclease n=1 Tax=Burkholderia stagnalis TaxID=1503054 RepID=UPI0009BDC2F7|nr:HNH endonuclease [Burkholderia stagnalis]